MSDTQPAPVPASAHPWHVPLPRQARRVTTKQIVDRKGLNMRIAIGVTTAIGTMWAFYIFAIWMGGWIGWQSSGLGRIIHDPYPFAFLLFLGNIVQLLLMPLIMVGQNVQSAHADARSEADFEVNQKSEVEIEKLLEGLRLIDERTLDIVRRLEAAEARSGPAPA
ncbi:MAG: DUF1003 domain-containing protein [Candidatus Dormibacteraceae bacterium]